MADKSDQVLPVCIVSKGNCPPEDCGGAIGFIRLCQQHSRFKLALRVAEIILEEGIEKITNQREFGIRKGEE